MSLPSGVSGLLKLALPVALGGALAGAIAWGADSGGDGNSPDAQQWAATPAPFTEGRATPAPVPDPNSIPPDLDALTNVSRTAAALRQTVDLCPSSYLLYESKLLGGSFCYPPTWTILLGDRVLLPPGQRPDGYSYALLVVKQDPATQQESARVAIQVVGSGSRPVDCPRAGSLAAGPHSAKVCFQERRIHAYNSLPGDVARIIVVTLPVMLPESGLPELRTAVQLRDATPGQPTVRYSRQDQQEGLEIIASIRFGP